MYQLLEVGDIIRKGDEHLSSVSGKWEDVSWYSGSEYEEEDFYLIRRKIDTSSASPEIIESNCVCAYCVHYCKVDNDCWEEGLGDYAQFEGRRLQAGAEEPAE